MATFAFNKYFHENVELWGDGNISNWTSMMDGTIDENLWKQSKVYFNAIEKGAMFDSRVFVMPQYEVVNCLIWRQQDCTRNSIQSVGQANFSHKQLEGKSCNDIQDMLMLEKGINWNDYPTHLKRGSCCIKVPVTINEGTENETVRSKWIIDNEIPIFTQDKEYVNKLVFV
jgi:tRNA(His) 5'-end guanylyltransferase